VRGMKGGCEDREKRAVGPRGEMNEDVTAMY
jgi:hypothetical protein